MKLILTLFLIVNIHPLISQSADFKFPNCQPIIGNYLWASETEVTNYFYLEFLHALKHTEDETTINKMLPDTSVWNEILNNPSPYESYYFRHPAYRDYPVVGVSKKQAEAYCVWLEKTLNNYISMDEKHPVKKITVRLPTDAEWQLAARGGNPHAEYPWKFEDMRNTDKKYKGDILANYVRGRGDYLGVAGSLSDNADVTAPVRSYWPNEFGLYNMAGNVAEMVSEEGRTRGGSWASRAKFLKINGEDEFEGFTKPSAKIGFRYFIEVVSFKDEGDKKPLKFDAKFIEDLIIYTPGKTFNFTAKTEVTNQLFQLFLNKTKRELSTATTRWEKVTDYPSIWSNDYTNHSNFKNYPVVNISKEEARGFCNWLTLEYAKMSKAKHVGLVFRLPKEKEWEAAARGDLQNVVYPWGGPYIRNSRGDYLCNFNPVYDKWIYDGKEQYVNPEITTKEIKNAGDLDGFLVLAPVGSYFPNGWGLYNMSGNISEFIEDGDFTKGGSWASLLHKVLISSREKYEGPSPSIGFRFFGSFPENN